MLLVKLRITSYESPLRIEGYVHDRYISFREKGGMWTFHVSSRLSRKSTEWDGGLLDEGECPEDINPISAMGLIKTLVYAHLGVNLYRVPSRELLSL